MSNETNQKPIDLKNFVEHCADFRFTPTGPGDWEYGPVMRSEFFALVAAFSEQVKGVLDQEFFFKGTYTKALEMPYSGDRPIEANGVQLNPGDPHLRLKFSGFPEIYPDIRISSVIAQKRGIIKTRAAKELIKKHFFAPKIAQLLRDDLQGLAGKMQDSDVPTILGLKSYDYDNCRDLYTTRMGFTFSPIQWKTPPFKCDHLLGITTREDFLRSLDSLTHLSEEDRNMIQEIDDPSNWEPYLGRFGGVRELKDKRGGR